MLSHFSHQLHIRYLPTIFSLLHPIFYFVFFLFKRIFNLWRIPCGNIMMRVCYINNYQQSFMLHILCIVDPFVATHTHVCNLYLIDTQIHTFIALASAMKRKLKFIDSFFIQLQMLFDFPTALSLLNLQQLKAKRNEKSFVLIPNCLKK